MTGWRRWRPLVGGAFFGALTAVAAFGVASLLVGPTRGYVALSAGPAGSVWRVDRATGQVSLCQPPPAADARPACSPWSRE